MILSISARLAHAKLNGLVLPLGSKPLNLVVDNSVPLSILVLTAGVPSRHREEFDIRLQRRGCRHPSKSP
jgi:hypothetical protein